MPEMTKKARPAFNVGSQSSSGSKSHSNSSRSPHKVSQAPPAVLPQIRSSPPVVKTAAAKAKAGKTKSATALPSQVQPPPKQVLPGKRRIVVASTSSEYETTDTESFDEEIDEGVVDGDDDGGSWHSEGPDVEEMIREVEEKRAAEAATKHSRVQEQQAKKDKRRSQSRYNEKEAVRLSDAAEKAEYYQNLFNKVPKDAYANPMLQRRTQSGLSLLMKTDPNAFLATTSFSSSNLRGLGGAAPLSALSATRKDYPAQQQQQRQQPLSQLGPAAQAPPPKVAPVTRQPPPPAQPPRAGPSKMPTPLGLSLSKSSVALPQMTHQRASPPPLVSGGSGGRRPPSKMEFESDSEDEDPDDVIQVSESIAQVKLAELVGRQAAKGKGKVPPPAPLPQVAPNQTLPPHHPQHDLGRPQQYQQQQTLTRPGMPPSTASAPIPLGHQYNPAPPMTPRATRRNMLKNELSESLRRNLLWERQLSRVNSAAITRRQSSTGIAGGQLRPLSALPEPPHTAAAAIGQVVRVTYKNPNAPPMIEPMSPTQVVRENGGRKAGAAAAMVVVDEKLRRPPSQQQPQQNGAAVPRFKSWSNDNRTSWG